MTAPTDVGLGPVATELREACEDVWRLAEADHARNWQAEPGLSSSGSCERAAGYAHHRAPWSDVPAPGRAALLGTWIHEPYLRYLATLLGADLVEHEVRVDGVLGHLDLATGTGVVDLKTVTESGPARAREHGPKRTHLWQVMCYAEARRRAGAAISWVAIVYLDRGRGEDYVWVGEFDPEVASEALAWWGSVLAAPDPDLLPRGGRGPGLDVMCDGCPWRSRCWGPDGQPVLLDEAEHRDAAVESALAAYREASDRESAAKRDKEFYRSLLEGEPKGGYGSWQIKRWQSTGRRLNAKAARSRLEALGEPVPMTDPSYWPVVARRDPAAEEVN